LNKRIIQKFFLVKQTDQRSKIFLKYIDLWSVCDIILETKEMTKSQNVNYSRAELVFLDLGHVIKKEDKV